MVNGWPNPFTNLIQHLLLVRPVGIFQIQKVFRSIDPICTEMKLAVLSDRFNPYTFIMPIPTVKTMWFHVAQIQSRRKSGYNEDRKDPELTASLFQGEVDEHAYSEKRE